MPRDSTRFPIVRSALTCAAVMISAVASYPGAARAAVLAEEAGQPKTACGSAGGTLQASQPNVVIAAHTTKGSAILGGQPSALELIRLSQEQDGTTGLASSQDAFAAAEDSATEATLSPAAG